MTVMFVLVFVQWEFVCLFVFHVESQQQWWCHSRLNAGYMGTVFVMSEASYLDSAVTEKSVQRHTQQTHLTLHTSLTETNLHTHVCVCVCVIQTGWVEESVCHIRFLAVFVACVCEFKTRICSHTLAGRHHWNIILHTHTRTQHVFISSHVTFTCQWVDSVKASFH